MLLVSNSTARRASESEANPISLVLKSPDSPSLPKPKYRQMRRKEQDRLARMDADYQRRKEIAEFNMRREERMKAAEERTAKKRLKRQKKKQKKKEKKTKTSGDDGEEHQEEEKHKEESSDSEDSDYDDSEQLKLSISDNIH